MGKLLFGFALFIFSAPSCFAHSAIVIGYDGRDEPRSYYATNYPTLEQAQQTAINGCRNSGLQRCFVLIDFASLCSAIYIDRNQNLKAGYGQSTASAVAHATNVLCQGGTCRQLQAPVCDQTTSGGISVSVHMSPDEWTIIIGIGGVVVLLVMSGVFLYLVQKKQDKAQQALREKEVADARQQQLDGLLAAVPNEPLKSMRATVQTNTFKSLDGAYHHAVDMILELTETERAIIKEHELDDIVLEDVPLFSKDDLLQQEAQIAEHREAFERATTKGKMIREKLAERVDELSLEYMKTARLKTTIGQLLVSPYTRAFNSPHEANDFAEVLKKKFLPEMKRIIEKHGSHKQTETLQF